MILVLPVVFLFAAVVAQASATPSGPIASFTYTVDATTVHFEDTTIGPNLMTWSWMFGDGQWASEQSPTHKFPGGAKYQVTLAVTDAAGRTSTTTQVVKTAADKTLTPIVIGQSLFVILVFASALTIVLAKTPPVRIGAAVALLVSIVLWAIWR
jgi:hypothetical protein